MGQLPECISRRKTAKGHNTTSICRLALMRVLMLSGILREESRPAVLNTDYWILNFCLSVTSTTGHIMKHLLLATTALAAVAIASAASAADLGTRAPVYTKAPVYAPVSNWTGLYLGGNVGYGWGNNDMSLAESTALEGFANQSFGNHSNGVIGGGQVGYNWQMGSFLTGLEADIQGSGIHGTSNSPLTSIFGPNNTFSGSSEAKLSWFGTVRARLGVTLTPDLLLFGSGGLAYGNVRNSANADASFGAGIAHQDFPAQTSQTKAGWALGGGAEWMFTRGWSAKVEYLHIDLGKTSAVGSAVASGGSPPIIDSVNYTFHDHFDTVRFGVNYHFN
jgi:outer membrane immunogenic protein